jgi:hypothetical protein
LLRVFVHDSEAHQFSHYPHTFFFLRSTFILSYHLHLFFQMTAFYEVSLQFIPPLSFKPFSSFSIFMLSSYPFLGLPSGRFLIGFSSHRSTSYTHLIHFLIFRFQYYPPISFPVFEVSAS